MLNIKKVDLHHIYFFSIYRHPFSLWTGAPNIIHYLLNFQCINSESDPNIVRIVNFISFFPIFSGK